ncbi:hypothetical protein JXB12_13630 [candidate division KSB1 bacterium]|nr:hypothetical protein [candidate division KSB1 bacterium]
MRNISIVLCMVLILMLVVGCAKRIAIQFDEIQNGEIVNVETVDGESKSGLVKAKNSAMLILQPVKNDPNLIKVTREQIDQITITPPVYDDKNEIISEWEIQDVRTNKNRILYTIGGMGLSFGASFFIGSLAHRNLTDSENRDEALWGITGLGTILGAWFFQRNGAKKDRESAIAEIRERRYLEAKEKMELQQLKQEEVQKELDKAKTSRRKQDEEIQRLKDRLKERDQKAEQGDNIE